MNFPDLQIWTFLIKSRISKLCRKSERLAMLGPIFLHGNQGLKLRRAPLDGVCLLWFATDSTTPYCPIIAFLPMYTLHRVLVGI